MESMLLESVLAFLIAIMQMFSGASDTFAYQGEGTVTIDSNQFGYAVGAQDNDGKLSIALDALVGGASVAHVEATPDSAAIESFAGGASLDAEGAAKLLTGLADQSWLANVDIEKLLDYALNGGSESDAPWIATAINALDVTRYIATTADDDGMYSHRLTLGYGDITRFLVDMMRNVTRPDGALDALENLKIWKALELDGQELCRMLRWGIDSARMALARDYTTLLNMLSLELRWRTNYAVPFTYTDAVQLSFSGGKVKVEAELDLNKLGLEGQWQIEGWEPHSFSALRVGRGYQIDVDLDSFRICARYDPLSRDRVFTADVLYSYVYYSGARDTSTLLSLDMGNRSLNVYLNGMNDSDDFSLSVLWRHGSYDATLYGISGSTRLEATLHGKLGSGADGVLTHLAKLDCAMYEYMNVRPTKNITGELMQSLRPQSGDKPLTHTLTASIDDGVEKHTIECRSSHLLTTR